MRSNDPTAYRRAYWTARAQMQDSTPAPHLSAASRHIVARAASALRCVISDDHVRGAAIDDAARRGLAAIAKFTSTDPWSTHHGAALEALQEVAKKIRSAAWAAELEACSAAFEALEDDARVWEGRNPLHEVASPPLSLQKRGLSKKEWQRLQDAYNARSLRKNRSLLEDLAAQEKLDVILVQETRSKTALEIPGYTGHPLPLGAVQRAGRWASHSKQRQKHPRHLSRCRLPQNGDHVLPPLGKLGPQAGVVRHWMQAPAPLDTPDEVEEAATRLSEAIRTALDEATPRAKPGRADPGRLPLDILIQKSYRKLGSSCPSRPPNRRWPTQSAARSSRGAVEPSTSGTPSRRTTRHQS